jgi:hypothetical protein
MHLASDIIERLIGPKASLARTPRVFGERPAHRSSGRLQHRKSRDAFDFGCRDVAG